MPSSTPGTLSVQLFSVRDAIAEDQGRALARLAEIGMNWVEPYGIGTDLGRAQQLRRDLDAAGLRASSTHATFPPHLDQLVEELVTIGAERVFLPVPSAAPGTAREAFSQRDSLDRLADYLAGAASDLAGHGISVGYHNHWWEWDDVDGQAAYDRFLERTGEAVGVELDAYWALQGGQDPASLARALGGRVTALHIKSGPAPEGVLTLEGAMALDQVPLTEGALDHESLLTGSSARWHVLEVDHSTTDTYELLRRNAQTVVDAGLSTF